MTNLKRTKMESRLHREVWLIRIDGPKIACIPAIVCITQNRSAVTSLEMNHSES